MITGPLHSSSVGKPNNEAVWRLLYYVMDVSVELEKAEQAAQQPQSETACPGEESEVEPVAAKA